jgi:hypothetical protein
VSTGAYANNPFFVLGFHGCDRSVGEAVLAGEIDLRASEKDYDWLGNGIYFWENNPVRAMRWAEWSAAQPWSKVEDPFVVGAVIDLGHCLSLLQTDGIEAINSAYKMLKEASEAEGVPPLPENDGVMRRLDCRVVQVLHSIREYAELPPFDTVRGMFPEGEELYPNAGFRDQNHIQLCVRSRSCIKGYFRPID